MEIEVKKPIIETIESENNLSKIWGTSTCKTERSWINTQIKRCIKSNNQEMLKIMENFLRVHNYYYPEMKATVPLKQFKGYSGIKIERFPNYYKTIRYQKKDEGIKEIVTIIENDLLNSIICSINKFDIEKKVPTWQIAQEYCKKVNLYKDENRYFFDESGFNWKYFSGNRKVYLPFWMSIRILQHYGMINYLKDGHIIRLKNSIEVPCEFV